MRRDLLMTATKNKNNRASRFAEGLDYHGDRKTYLREYQKRLRDFEIEQAEKQKKILSIQHPWLLTVPKTKIEVVFLDEISENSIKAKAKPKKKLTAEEIQRKKEYQKQYQAKNREKLKEKRRARNKREFEW